MECKWNRIWIFANDIPEIMEGFFNNPLEAIDLDKCSETHLESLYATLNCEEED